MENDMAARAGVVEVDDSSFEAEVIASKLPVLVDFASRWCGPCKTLAPIVERLAAEKAGSIKVVKVDTDASPSTTKRYGVRGVPTVLVFRDGSVTAQHLGATTKERLLSLLEH
jgi:thioredoxin 1